MTMRPDEEMNFWAFVGLFALLVLIVLIIAVYKLITWCYRLIFCYTLYHYTDSDGHDGIQNSGVIRASGLTGRDAYYGYGVYLTSLDPSEGRDKIALNNWNGCKYAILCCVLQILPYWYKQMI